MKRDIIKIIWLYSKLMSIYGDYGNILTLKKRLEWRGYGADIVEIGLGERIPKDADLVFMGGGQDRQQTLCVEDLIEHKEDYLLELVEKNTPMLFVCGAYQLMGEFYHPLTAEEISEFDSHNFGKSYSRETTTARFKSKSGADLTGAGILPVYTVHFGNHKPRAIGNVIVEISPQLKAEIDAIYTYERLSTFVGFENHGGRTYPTNGWSNSLSPLGLVIEGFGNNGEDKTEGILYKNSIGTYLHGPILPKNPHLADFLISHALINKFKNDKLVKIDDRLEVMAHIAMEF